MLYEIATVSTGLRDFVVIQDFNTMQIWINEWLGGTLYEIDDDALFHDIYAFLQENRILTVNAN
jgi:hypothetical protein